MECIQNITSYFGYEYDTLVKIFKVEFIPRFAKFISKFLKLSNKKGEIMSNITKIRKGAGAFEDGGNKEEREEDYEANIKDAESDDENDEHEYEDVDGTKSKKKENTEETYTDEEEISEDNNVIDVNEEADPDADVDADDNDVKMTNQEDETDANDDDDCANTNTKEKKKIYNKDKEVLNSKTFSWEEVRIDHMMLSANSEVDAESNDSYFNFELCIPYTQKNMLIKNMLDHTLKSITFKSVRNVNRCHVIDKKVNGVTKFQLQLEGINFEEVIRHAHLIDINKIYTNDIGNIIERYGVRLFY
jgi:hypothetical protein